MSSFWRDRLHSEGWALWLTSGLLASNIIRVLCKYTGGEQSHNCVMFLFVVVVLRPKQSGKISLFTIFEN